MTTIVKAHNHTHRFFQPKVIEKITLYVLAAVFVSLVFVGIEEEVANASQNTTLSPDSNKIINLDYINR